jgi:hypothetical protein
MSIGGSGSLTVSSFTANANYSIGAWVYDTTWVACTPQHFATMMAHLVAQSGMQGLDWELLNEPDGGNWNVTSTLLVQLYKLTYPAMKAADPTCVIHGLVLQSICGPGFEYGADYYNACVTDGILTGNGSGGPCYDVISLHSYCQNSTFNDWEAPEAITVFGYPLWQLLANFKANMVAKGDTSNIWITEFGWQNADDGPMTPQLQAQYYQDFLTRLSSNDPINGVPFSSYLKVMMQYAMSTGGAQWSITGVGAQTVITELISGH